MSLYLMKLIYVIWNSLKFEVNQSKLTKKDVFDLDLTLEHVFFAVASFKSSGTPFQWKLIKTLWQRRIINLKVYLGQASIRNGVLN